LCSMEERDVLKRIEKLIHRRLSVEETPHLHPIVVPSRSAAVQAFASATGGSSTGRERGGSGNAGASSRSSDRRPPRAAYGKPNSERGGTGSASQGSYRGRRPN
jgi:hypothetical protein